MLQLRIDEILDEQEHTKYWLFKRMEPMSYQNFNKIYNNETSSIKFDTLEKLKNALGVSYDDLFRENQSWIIVESKFQRWYIIDKESTHSKVDAPELELISSQWEPPLSFADERGIIFFACCSSYRES